MQVVGSIKPTGDIEALPAFTLIPFPCFCDNLADMKGFFIVGKSVELIPVFFTADGLVVNFHHALVLASDDSGAGSRQTWFAERLVLRRETRASKL